MKIKITEEQKNDSFLLRLDLQKNTEHKNKRPVQNKKRNKTKSPFGFAAAIHHD